GGGGPSDFRYAGTLPCPIVPPDVVTCCRRPRPHPAAIISLELDAKRPTPGIEKQQGSQVGDGPATGEDDPSNASPKHWPANRIATVERVGNGAARERRRSLPGRHCAATRRTDPAADPPPG